MRYIFPATYQAQNGKSKATLQIILKSLSEQLQATNEPCILVVCLFSNILHAIEKQNHKFNLGTTKNWTVLKI